MSRYGYPPREWEQQESGWLILCTWEGRPVGAVHKEPSGMWRASLTGGLALQHACFPTRKEAQTAVERAT